MRLEFTKMHGLGNDFVVIDLVTQRVRLEAPQIRQIADRHFGYDTLVPAFKIASNTKTTSIWYCCTCWQA